MAITGSRSTFPSAIDIFTEQFDISGSQVADSARWNVLRLMTSRTSAEEAEYNALCISLAPNILTAEAFNKLLDAQYNIENFTKTTITDYYKYQGVWSITTPYTIFNTVTFSDDGCTYLCLQSNTGHAPSETAYWLQNSSKGMTGEKGDPGANLVNKQTYNNSYAYNLNDLVQYNGVTYYCIQASVGHLPTDTNFWSVFLSPPALPVISTQELLITTTNLTTVVTHTPTVAKNIQATIYFRVITGTTNVSIQITYTDVTGAQTLNLLTTQSCPIGSYTLLPVFINSTASAITISIQAGTSNRVYASASVLEV